MSQQQSWPVLTEQKVDAEARSVVDDIYAAVPFMIGKISSDGTSTRKRLGEEKDEFRAITAVFATRLLYVAAHVRPTLSSSQRQWTAEQLEFVGRERGIGHALRLKENLGYTG